MGQMNITPVIKNLLLINVLIFIIVNTLGDVIGVQNISLWMMVRYPTSELFRPIQLVTHMFSHGSISHIFFNMFGLLAIGPPIEYMWGARRFLFYYLFSGFGSIILDYGIKFFQLNFTNVSPEEAYLLVNIPSLGASGAIFGVLAAFAMLLPDNKLQLIFLPFPIKAKYFVAGYAAFELVSGVVGFQPGVNHFAHLGGAIFGVLLILYWRNGGTIGKN